MKWNLILGFLFATGVTLGAQRAAGAAACSESDYVVNKWCKREVPNTNPQEYTIEFEVAPSSGNSAGVVAMATSSGAKAGNLGRGDASVTSSKGVAKSTQNTTIHATTTVMLQARLAPPSSCSPPVTLKQGNPGATSGSAYIPPCS